MTTIKFKDVEPHSLDCVLNSLRDFAVARITLIPAPEFIPDVEWEIVAHFRKETDAQDARNDIRKMLAIIQ